jgi:hypothetical protein
VLNITHKIYEVGNVEEKCYFIFSLQYVTSIIPNPVEWVLLLWLSGNLVSEV